MVSNLRTTQGCSREFFFVFLCIVHLKKNKEENYISTHTENDENQNKLIVQVATYYRECSVSCNKAHDFSKSIYSYYLANPE